MRSNLVKTDRYPSAVRFLSFSLPLPQPLQAQDLECSLHEALKTQVGEHQILRWAITAVDPKAQQGTVEAVITLSR